MSLTDDNTPPSLPAAPGGAEAPQPGMVPLRVNGQYVKDLSFENPRAPHSLQEQSAQPAIEVSVDVQASRLAQSTYETVLSVTAEAKAGDEALFLVELSYAGVFTLADSVPAQHVQPILLIECPRLLFPFARAIVADVTRDGGFPPLLIQPVDFADLFRRSQMERAKGGNSADKVRISAES